MILAAASDDHTDDTDQRRGLTSTDDRGEGGDGCAMIRTPMRRRERKRWQGWKRRDWLRAARAGKGSSVGKGGTGGKGGGKGGSTGQTGKGYSGGKGSTSTSSSRGTTTGEGIDYGSTQGGRPDGRL
jgi:hypothetical protein